MINLTETNNNVQTVEEKFLPVIDNAQMSIEFNNDINAYEISGYNELYNALEQLDQEADNYIYQEDDRQGVKRFRAQINKFSKAIKDHTRDTQKDLFGTVKDEEKEIVNKLNSIANKINRGIIEEDRRYKEEKENNLKENFNEAKDAYEHLSDINFEYEKISKSSWLNRSITEIKAIGELNDRLQNLNILIGELKSQFNFDDIEIDFIFQNLNKTSWDGLQALGRIKTHYQQEEARIQREVERRMAKEEAERKKQEEAKALRETQSEVPSTASNQTEVNNTKKEIQADEAALIVPKSELKRIEVALNRLNIPFRIGD